MECLESHKGQLVLNMLNACLNIGSQCRDCSKGVMCDVLGVMCQISPFDLVQCLFSVSASDRDFSVL